MEIPTIQYHQSEQLALNLVLAAMMFAVALDVKPSDFRRVIDAPQIPAYGMIAQFLLLPFASWVATMLLDLPAGVELGMILVACCPGGNISNFITYLARGNTALSISMTAVASTAAVILMPLNFTFWSGLNPKTAALLQSIRVEGAEIFFSLFIVLAIPLLLGQFMVRTRPEFAARLHRTLKPLTVSALIAFISVAVYKNVDAFKADIWQILSLLVLHNTLAFLIGWLVARARSLERKNRRAFAVEVGMQNSSLALAVIFSKFHGETGMVLVAGFWGVWHIIAGALFALGCHIQDRIFAMVPATTKPDGN